MKNLITSLFLILSFSVSAQWNETNNCTTYVPPDPQDSVFVVMSDSRVGVSECRGVWRSIEDAGVPRYKAYVALMSQTAQGNPVATVLYNTLGVTLTWTYSDVGIYTATASGDVFTPGYTPQISGLLKAGEAYAFYGLSGGETNFELRTYASAGGALTDALLDGLTPIEIRVYHLY